MFLPWLLSAALAADDRDHDDIVDPLDQCPDEAEDERGFQTFLDGCPRPFDDHDGDGFADLHDACKYEPEPKRVQGLPDGCPMKGPDTDRDGIADMYDRCPEQAEDFATRDPHDTTANIAERLDGCPAPPTSAPPVAPAVTPSAGPTVTPSAGPSVTPSVTPAVTPSVTPAVTPSPVVSRPPPAVSPSSPAALPPSGETPFGSCTGRITRLACDQAGILTLEFACDGYAPRAFRTGVNLVVPSKFPIVGTVGDLAWGPGVGNEREWTLFTVPPDRVYKPVHYADELFMDDG